MASPGDFTVTLLGTGTPKPSPDRFGPSTLIEAGDQKLLIDAGRGATIRLSQLKLPIGRLDALLLTHFHSDHTCGIPDLWLTGWLPSSYGRRKSPFRVIGPHGTKTLISKLAEAYAADTRIRLADEGLPPEGIATVVTEFEQDGAVFEKNGVKVVAFEVDHGDLVKPAYGYRIEYGTHVALISGDTRYCRNVIRYGAGVDLLVHEVAAARPEILKEAFAQRIVRHHVTPREAGLVFAQAGPRLAVFTHMVLVGSDRVSAPTLEDVVRETRQTYGGPLEIGEDLMSFEIGDTIAIRRR
jgi:ribonuclease Z